MDLEGWWERGRENHLGATEKRGDDGVGIPRHESIHQQPTLLLLRRALRQRRPVPVVVVGDRRLQRGLLGGAGLAVAVEAGEPVAEHLKECS